MPKPVLILRSVCSVVAGYVLLAVANMAFVMVFFVPPTLGWPDIAIAVAGVPFTVLCAGFTGYAVGWIAGRSERLHAWIVAGLMGAVIVVSLMIDVAAEPAWYKAEYLVLMLAATIAGASLLSHTRKRAQSVTPTPS